MVKKKFFITTLLFVLAFILIITPVRSWLRSIVVNASKPIESSTSRLGFRINRFFNIFTDIKEVKQENKMLSERLVQSEVDRSEITELQHENELLKKELSYINASSSKQQLIPTRVIGRDPVSFLDHIIIDRGRQDGIVSGLAAVSSGVLVGQVSEVYDTTAKVTLITSKDSLILAMLQNSRAKGILRGGISGTMLENIAQDISIGPDEYVITSGLDGQLPQGILIGKTGPIQSSTSDLFKNVSVEPIADMSKLELIFIMK